MVFTLLVFLATQCHALKVYQSLLSANSQSGLAGLKFKGPLKDVEFSNSITACARFNFGRLQRSVLFDFGNQQHDDFLRIKVKHPATWVVLGDSLKGPRSFASWVLQDPISKDYTVFFGNKWHHMQPPCYFPFI